MFQIRKKPTRPTQPYPATLSANNQHKQEDGLHNDGEDDCDDMKVAMIMTIGNDDNLGDDDVVGWADDGDQG